MDYLGSVIASCSLHSSKQQQSSPIIMSQYYGKCMLCSAIQQVLLNLVYSLCCSTDASKLFAVKFSHCRPLNLCRTKYFIIPAQHISLRPTFNCQAQQLANISHGVALLTHYSFGPLRVWYNKTNKFYCTVMFRLKR